MVWYVFFNFDSTNIGPGMLILDFCEFFRNKETLWMDPKNPRKFICWMLNEPARRQLRLNISIYDVNMMLSHMSIFFSEFDQSICYY